MTASQDAQGLGDPALDPKRSQPCHGPGGESGVSCSKGRCFALNLSRTVFCFMFGLMSRPSGAQALPSGITSGRLREPFRMLEIEASQPCAGQSALPTGLLFWPLFFFVFIWLWYSGITPAPILTPHALRESKLGQLLATQAPYLFCWYPHPKNFC